MGCQILNANKCLAFALALVATPALGASIAKECEGVLSDFEVPGDPEVWTASQTAKMLNHPALSMVVSPLGAPKVKGAVLSLELSMIPAMRCADRVVWYNNGLKTEETNKVPLLPRPRLQVGLPKLAGFDGYLGVAYVPPVPLGSTSMHHAGFELGLSRSLSASLTAGLRYHAAVSKVADDIAQAVDDTAPTVLDFYANGMWGLGLHAGYEGGGLPKGFALYSGFGYVNVGTFFLVGDDAVIQNNPDPYRGVEYSLGGQFDVGALVLSLEWHHAVGSTMRTVRSKLGYRF